ncbi:MAG: extracellular solute-binding protein [Clostridia bacterium]|nr:extracellular solute-binding protein [Clostridia bacterium]
MKKRIFALVLALIMLSCCFISCSDNSDGDGKDTTVNTSAGTSGEDAGHGLPDVQYGKAVVVLTRKNEVYLKDVFVKSIDEQSTAVDKAVYNRNQIVESEFGVDFLSITADDEKDMDTKISIDVAAGESEYHIIAGHGRNMFSNAIAGNLIDWNELDYVDLDAEWWSNSAREEWSTPGGKLYLMTGDISYMGVGSAPVMFFNKTYVADSQLKSPYDLVYDNEWTLEKFKQYVISLDATLEVQGTGSGDIATDTFGYVTEQWRGPGYAPFCAGGKTLVLNESGVYELGQADEKTGNALQTYYELVVQSGAVYYDTKTSISSIRNAFAGGAAAFYDDCISEAVKLKSSGVDFGIVPWPKYDSEQESYNLVVGCGTNAFGVLINTKEEDREFISVILEAMAYYGGTEVIPYYFDTVVSYQAFKDSDSIEMLKVVRRDLHYDFGGWSGFGNFTNVGRDVIKRNGTPASTILMEYASASQAALDAWYALDKAE